MKISSGGSEQKMEEYTWGETSIIEFCPEKMINEFMARVDPNGKQNERMYKKHFSTIISKLKERRQKLLKL